MSMKLFVFSFLALMMVPIGVLAQDASQPQPEPPDNPPLIAKQIEQFVQTYVAAFNAGDVSKLETLWSPEGVFVDEATGEQLTGRTAIIASLRQTFADHPGLKIACNTRSIDSPSPSVAIEDGHALVTRTDGTTSQSHYRVVYVKRNQSWLIDRVTDNVSEKNETDSAEPVENPLRELDWLVGRWVDRGEESSIKLACDWTRGETFLSRKYSVSIGDDVETSGLELIGWDANLKKIRSWLFDAKGTVVQRIWTKQTDHWRIQSVATFPDGKRGSATTIVTPLDDDSYRVEKINRVIDGELQPSLEAITVVRDE